MEYHSIQDLDAALDQAVVKPLAEMKLTSKLQVARGYLAAAWIFALCTTCLSTSMDCVDPEHNDMLLDNVIHVSDIVLTGKIDTVRREDNGGTMTANVSYFYAYKRDREFPKASGATEVHNFAIDSRGGVVVHVFFLVREPQGRLALLCAAPLELQDALRVLNRVKKVGRGQFVL